MGKSFFEKLNEIHDEKEETATDEKIEINDDSVDNVVDSENNDKDNINNSDSTESIENTGDTDNTEEVIDTIFKKINISKGNEDVKVGIESPDDFFARIQKDYNIKVNTFDDMFGVLDKVKATEDKYKEVSGKASDYEQIFGNLPVEIKSAISDYYENRDYKKTLKSVIDSGIDYNKDVNSYQKDQLIKIYNSDITDDELEDMEETIKDRLYKLSSETYKRDQSDYVNKSNEFIKNRDASAKMFMSSIDESVSELKSKFPDFDEKNINSVREMMKSNYLSLLFNENGTYKKDAALKVAMAEYGLSAIDKMQEQLEKRYSKKVKDIVSTEREKILTERLNDNITKENHGDNGVTSKEAIVKSMPFLKRK